MKILLLILISVVCNAQSKPALVVKNSTTIDTVTTDVIRTVTDKYFTISITSVSQGGKKYYFAVNEIERHANPFKMVDDTIVNKKGELEKFQDAAAFLNYMDARGYDVKFEKPLKYGATYTFVRK